MFFHLNKEMMPFLENKYKIIVPGSKYVRQMKDIFYYLNIKTNNSND